MMTSDVTRTRAWIMAIRPATLLTGLAPVLLGLAFGLKQVLYGSRSLRLSHAVVSLFACLLVVLLQSAANLVNDAKDAEKGVDQRGRLGPTRVVQSGLISKELVRLAYSLCFVMATLIVLGMFVWTKDWLVIAVASLCGVAAFAYTAGPFPLSYFALGEAVAFIFFGPIAVMGSAYLQTGVIDASVAVWGSGCGLISAAIMAINNFRDRSTDMRAGKHTLATLLGHDHGKRLPTLFVVLSLLLLFFYCANHEVAALGVLGVVGGVIYLLKRIMPALSAKGPAINLGLKYTAQFNLFYALYFILCVSVGSL
jgi:1,4-dihydroxy-2-naphthoate octaprenyltransferase